MPPERARGEPLPAQGGSIAALRRITPYLRPYAGQLIAMLVAALISVAAQLAIPLLIESVINGAISDHRRALLIPLGLAALALGVAEAAGMLVRRWVQGTAITGIEQSMRTDVYAHVQRLHPGFHDSWQSGQLLSRATTDLSAIRRFAGFGLVYFIINIVTFAAVVVLLVRLNWWLGLLTGGLFAPVVMVCTRFERKYKVLSRRAQDQQGDLATFIEESAGGIRVLKALGRRREAARQHAAGAAIVYRTQVEKARLLGAFWAVLDLMPNTALGFIMLLGAFAVGRHELSLGGLVAFIALALQLVWPIEAMGYVLASAQEAGTAAQRVYELLDTKPAITDHAAGDGPAGGAPAGGLARHGRATAGARLAFSHVAFSYPGASQPVLSDVTLELEPGKTMVLTGATGSGKTTLLQLVPRLADITAGTITLDGTDISELPLDALRTRVACAFEEATLFSASVRENVTFGAPAASDEDIAAALAAAQAAFAYDLPWGLDTRIGEQGMSLSGGQRQRIALARAILSGPDVLLLDDPLSAVDVQTEARATRALGQVLAGTTALVVAHRPSTVLLADTVALLKGGRIAAVGTHRELMAAEPAYRDLMTMSAAPAGPGPGGGEQVTAQTWQGQAAPQAEEPDGPSRAEAAMITKRSRRLLADLLGRDRRRAIWTTVLIMVASLAALIGPWLVGLGIDDGIPPLSRDGNAGPLVGLTVAFGVTVAVQALATRSYIYAMGQLGERIVIDLRKRLFAHFQELSVAFHEEYTSGKVISRQTSDIDAITSLFEDGMDSLVSAVVTLVLVGVGMLLLNWQLGLIVLAGFIPLTWLTAWFRRESATTYRRSREAIAQVIVQFVETMTGIRAVQAFRRQPRNDEIFAELNDAYCEATLRSYRLVALYAPAITLVGNVITAGMLCYGGLLVIDGDVKVGVLVTFLLYLRRFFDPLQDLAQFYNSFQGAAAALEKLSGVLAEQPSVPAPTAGATLPGRPGGGRAVTFTGVTFGYSGRPVIEDLNLEIPAGQTTALVGSTGAGKTTVARLLARFYDPDAGRVALDGVDLRDLDDPALRTEVVLITQENFLFSGTIADNIRLGRPAADQAEIEAAARAIGAHPFIAALPGGYDADVGKRGGRLSAGQRQLISFARAFLAAPAVLILDEATSLLDIPSERMLQRALQTMLAGRTAVIIAHRLSTVEIADRVLVLDHGRVVQDGPPAELLAGQGRFAQMHQSWRATLA